MRRFTNYLKESVANDVNPGNSLLVTGVTNHFTPVENILTNIRNLFCARLGVAADIGEDNVSIKLHSSFFVSEESVNKVLYNTLDGRLSLATYIQQQGLPIIKMINVGKYFVVYFCPNDMPSIAVSIPNVKQCDCADCDCGCDCQCDCDCCKCESLLEEYNLTEAEYTNLITEDDSEEEIKDVTLEKVSELIEMKDKVKAAKQLEILVDQQIELPREYYFAAIKFKSGEEAIALRWKYSKNLPTGKSVENTRSIMHIFGKGDKGIWVQDFAKDSLVKLPDEVKKLIENILEMMEAEETDDPAVYKLTGKKKERKAKDKDEDKKDNKEDNQEEKEDKKDDKKSDNDEDEVESDDDRGDDSDNLL